MLPVAERVRPPSAQRARRAAARSPGTPIGCGVEAAVGRILVLAATGGAQRKPGHRRAGAVVGNVRDDGEARPAVGAVDERVAVAAVGRVEQLAQAVGAGGTSGETGVARACGRVVARDDREGGVRRRRAADGSPPSRRHGRAPAARRAAPRTPPASDVARRPRSAPPSRRCPRNPVNRSPRQPVHERPEPDALHHPPHAQALPLDGLDSRHVPRLPVPARPATGRPLTGLRHSRTVRGRLYR